MKTHELHWHDLTGNLKAARDLSGIEYLRAMQAGRLNAPPIGSTFDLHFETIEPGRLSVRGRPHEFHYNPLGIVHGGFASTILDTALGCATMTLLPRGSIFTTVDLHVNFTRPMTVQTGEVVATAEVLNAGRKIVTSFARLEDASGKLYAHANSTCMVLPWPA